MSADIIEILLDKYEPHEIVELLQNYVDHEVIINALSDLIMDQFCEDGAFDEEWGQLYADED